MTRCLTRCAPIAIVLLFLGSIRAEAAKVAAVPLPESLAATTFDGFLTAFNATDLLELREFLGSQFKQAVLDGPQFEQYLEDLAQLRKQTGGVDLAWVLPSIDRHLAVVVEARSDRRTYLVNLYLDRSPPQKLKDIKFREPNLAIGAVAPPLDAGVEWLQGERVPSFEEGKLYLLDFWATWCGPCVQEIPDLSRIAAKYADLGVVVIGLATLPAEGAVPTDEFVAERGQAIGYRVAEEMGSTLLRRYTATSVPTKAIIDRDGRLAWIWPGGDAPVEEVLDLMLVGEYSPAPR